jgi:hypothetical protein
MVTTERVASLLVLRKLCSIFFFFYVLFLTLLAKKILSVITYIWEELLDIRAKPTYQHYDQEYGFLKGILCSNHPPLQSILLANVQSHKVDKIRARVAFQRGIWDCNILCFT